MKKLLCCILSIVIAGLLLPTTAFAADTECAAVGTITVVGTSNYCDAAISTYVNRVEVFFVAKEDVDIVSLEFGVKMDTDMINLTGISTIAPKDILIDINPSGDYRVTGAFSLDTPCQVKAGDEICTLVGDPLKDGITTVELTVINMTIRSGGKNVVVFKNGEYQDDTSYTVSGKLTSFLSNEETIVKIVNPSNGAVVKWTEATSAYSISGILPGTYILQASKIDHVDRDFVINVSSDMSLDVKLHPIGDVTGEGQVTTVDFGRANSHARGKSTLTGYEFDCANVVPDDKITTVDAGKINSHARGKSKLW